MNRKWAVQILAGSSVQSVILTTMSLPLILCYCLEMFALRESFPWPNSLFQIRRTKDPALKMTFVAVLEGNYQEVLPEGLRSARQLTGQHS